MWERLLGVFKKYAQLDKVVLFGSRSRGDYNYNSDIDLLVIENMREDYLDFIVDLDNAMGIYSFDVIRFKDLGNNRLAKEIERDGMTIYQRE